MNSTMAHRLCLVAAVLIFWGGCSDKPQKPISMVAEDKYISLLVELQLVRSYSETGQIDSVYADSLRNIVFNKYKVTSTAFWNSHKYYQQFPKQQKRRIEKAIEELRMDRVADSTSADGPPPK